MVHVNVLLDRSRNVIFLKKPKNVGTGQKRTLSFKSKKRKDVEIPYQCRNGARQMIFSQIELYLVLEFSLGIGR
jgi:hypothetical protein